MLCLTELIILSRWTLVFIQDLLDETVLVLYQFIVGLFFWVSFPILLLIVLLTGRHRRGLAERLGFYETSDGDHGRSRRKCIWVHAASIGEVRAAAILISRLKPELTGWKFLVTTMTVHGRDFAREHLDPDIACHLAPLDVPFVVSRAINILRPDIYVCLETELWPILIDRLKGSQVPALLINGRISAKSISRYRRFNGLFGPVLRNFAAIGAISEEDRQRFIEVGAVSESVTVTGNIKHDFILPPDRKRIERKWREILDIEGGVDVFIAGSTHSPEEQLLLPLIGILTGKYGQIAVIAPRHLDRLESIASLLTADRIEYQRLSELKRGERRKYSCIIVDSFGDLNELYSIATFVFLGGSLTGNGGHNVMEPAIWERVVFFGPHMDDFRQAADLLEKNGGGFSVADIAELETSIVSFLQDRQRLQEAQIRAGQTARQQRGAADHQAALILQSAAKP